MENSSYLRKANDNHMGENQSVIQELSQKLNQKDAELHQTIENY